MALRALAIKYLVYFTTILPELHCKIKSLKNDSLPQQDTTRLTTLPQVHAMTAVKTDGFNLCNRVGKLLFPIVPICVDQLDDAH